jgi:hypothetical protein
LVEARKADPSSREKPAGTHRTDLQCANTIVSGSGRKQIEKVNPH